MAHSNTAMSQLLKIFSRHEFEALTKEHYSGRKFRKFNRWTQFVAISSAQLSKRVGLRDLVFSLSAQASKPYHLGVLPTNCSTLGRVNDEKPYTLYEAMFGRLLQCWQTELFFKWIKQNLKLKTFLVTSKNAVLTQTWIALCVYLMLAWIKFKHRLNCSLQQILRLLQLNLFECRDILKLLQGKPDKSVNPNLNQLTLPIS